MNKGKILFIQVLLLCITVVFAASMLYIKSVQSTQAISAGSDIKRNLTFEDLARAIWEEGIEHDES